MNPEKTTYHFLKDARDKYANLTIHKYKNETKQYQDITYLKFYEQVKHTAMGLNGLSMRSGDCITLIADVGHRFMLASMAITNIGGIDVPRGTDATRDDLLYILSQTESRFLFLENISVFNKIKNDFASLQKLKYLIFFDEPEEMPSMAGVKTLSLQTLAENGHLLHLDNPDKFDYLGRRVQGDDLLTIIYTSGTTGNPKGVMLTHRNLIAEVDLLKKVLGAPTNMVTMGFLPPWHIAERLIETYLIHIGGTVAFTGVSTLAADMAAMRPTMLVSVPRVWESFYSKIHDGVAKAPALRRALFTGAKSIALAFFKAKSNLMGTRFFLKKPSLMGLVASKISSAIVLLALLLPNALGQLILGKVRKVLGGRLKFAFSGAGALPTHIDEFFCALGVPILEGYGMTETAGLSTLRELNHVVVGTVGKTLPGVEIKLLTEEGKVITQPGIKGVAWHKGPHIMQGYYKEPEKTSAVLQDGWLNSGDIMMLTTRGEYKFAGRAKDTIVLLGGENVEPEPIEKALVKSSFIDQAVVVGQDKKNLSALLILNYDMVKQQFLNEKFEKIEDLAGQPQVSHLIKQEIKANVSSKAGFKGFEKVTNFTILASAFEIGEELTPTMKVRRNYVFEKYQKEIEAMYKE